MRRASYTPLPTQAPAEPLIVVEESGGTDDEETPTKESSPQLTLHPGLLSPYRDMRKRSLPTPSCTSGITASQVRRLSEHGVEGSTAASMREAAFLATLSSAPAPSPGGRRHSVVTISRAPPPSILCSRGRRESIAAFPASSMQVTRVLANRRDSMSSVPRPPSTSGSTSGSQFNLQLDIMDDIAEIKAARKVRLKMWKTPSRERICEVQPLDGTAGTSASATRYHQVSPESSSRAEGSASNPISRRYSDFVPTQPAQHPKRRASEQVPPSASSSSVASPKQSSSAGIVCSNTDLISILSSLSSSAQEINKDPEEKTPCSLQSSTKEKNSLQEVQKSGSSSSTNADQKRSRLKNLRSNSFDVSMLLGTGVKPKQETGRCSSVAASWIVKRHQPKRSDPPKGQSPVMVNPAQDKQDAIVVQSSDASSKSPSESGQHKTSPSKSSSPPDHTVVWDGKSGSVVDAQVLGSAIEVFLARRGSGNDSSGGTSPQSSKVSPTKNSGKAATGSAGAGPSSSSSWFSGNKDGEDDAGASDSCDTSLCSTLKDLFVK